MISLDLFVSSLSFVYYCIGQLNEENDESTTDFKI